MKTQEAVNLFVNYCRERGLSKFTIDTRVSHLKHFVLDLPELPLEFAPIDRFLTRTIRKPSARITIRKTLLALYSFLQQQGLATNPIPPGKVGRPKKSNIYEEKSGRGGSNNSIRLDLHVFIHQASD